MENLEIVFEPNRLKLQSKYEFNKCKNCDQIPFFDNCETCSNEDCEEIFCKALY